MLKRLDDFDQQNMLSETVIVIEGPFVLVSFKITFRHDSPAEVLTSYSKHHFRRMAYPNTAKSKTTRD